MKLRDVIVKVMILTMRGNLPKHTCLLSMVKCISTTLKTYGHVSYPYVAWNEM
jgi:hypothetical protein